MHPSQEQPLRKNNVPYSIAINSKYTVNIDVLCRLVEMFMFLVVNV